MKISRKIISAAAAAILLAAPFATSEISSKFQSDGYTVEGLSIQEKFWNIFYPDEYDFKKESQNTNTYKKCPAINAVPTASKTTPLTCRVSFNDMYTWNKHDKKDAHCKNQKNKKDHKVWIKNKEGREKSASAKCGKAANASISCKWSTKITSMSAKWEYCDEWNKKVKEKYRKISSKIMLVK